MINLKKFNIEYTYGAILGIIGLILSFVIALLAGNNIGLVVAKSLIFASIFTGIGYFSMIITKQYIPEIYEILDFFKSSKEDKGITISSEQEDEDAEISPEDIAAVHDEEASVLDKSEKIDLENELLIQEESGAASKNINTYKSEENVDNHINKEVKKIKRYEPKFMAKAVQSMMKKDEE